MPPMFPRISFSIFASLNMAYHSWFIIFHSQKLQNRNDDANSILAFLASVLLKFQFLDTTPFHTHPKTTYVSITFFLGYAMARVTQPRLSSWLRYRPTYAYVVKHFVLTFGSLAVVSLASLLFPDRSRPILYVLSVVLLVAEPAFMVYKSIVRCLWIMQWLFAAVHSGSWRSSQCD